MQRTIYLIDSENIADHWVGHIRLQNVLDKIIIFWSKNSKSLSIWLLDTFLEMYPREQLEFIECYTGNNSMDFHIVTKLGQMTARPSKTQFVIVSDDTGYDGVINYLHDSGFSVTRLAGFKSAPQLPAPLMNRPELVNTIDMGNAASNSPCSEEHNTTAADMPKGPAIYWGVDGNGKPNRITPRQKARINQYMNDFFRDWPYAEHHKKEILQILTSIAYPSKKSMGKVYESLCNIPHVKISKMAAVYRALKQSILPAIDSIICQ